MNDVMQPWARCSLCDDQAPPLVAAEMGWALFVYADEDEDECDGHLLCEHCLDVMVAEGDAEDDEPEALPTRPGAVGLRYARRRGSR